MSRQTTTSAFHKSKTLDNKYMLGDEIGKGAYGRVYKGLDLENGDFVAIKQVSLENIAQEDLNIIMQEIDLLKNLNHKNIVKYLGSLKTRSHLHIILEYVENGSLANIIKPNKFGPFPESLVAVYIAQVLEGLVYLHEQGVIHRDIKGANILTTKEGLVKLADFGVATKLTEADVNTHSVVGTPYWMAPEVIEMSGVCAASDIWSVGCTVIELLTCVPPYYELQPMPALFRIVQDERPPIPESLSPDITDFLRQCFKKDARQRPDAKTLLSHPWIQNCRRALQSSLRHSGTMRNVEENGSADAEIPSEDNQSAGESLSAPKAEAFETGSRKELLSPAATHLSKSDKEHSSNGNLAEERVENPEDEPLSDQVPTLAIHEMSLVQTGSGRLPSNKITPTNDQSQLQEITNTSDKDEMLINGETQSPESRRKNLDSKHGGKGTSISVDNKSFGFSPRTDNNSLQKAVKTSATLGGNELSRFSDTPGDASLDDLFHPLEKSLEDRAAEASTSASASASHVNQSHAAVADTGKNDLATKLRATIAQKQMENEMGQTNGSGGDLFRLMIGVLKDDVIDIDGLVFDEKLPAENLFPLQAVEFSRLVGSLRPDESEDAIVSACQKLIAIFHQRPGQKQFFVTQHGLLPLMELLELPQTRVICSILQLINQIVKDNSDFQENACLVGLIPVVMGFAVPDRPREVRMEAAYFLQHLCQSSSLTLQMFIACRGIPVLVGFLEADYAKYREMVHLAIDGMWQVFKLQRSTPRNDFCRIAAKNGILLRLINTLYSLNEATRLASISVGGGFPGDGLAERPRSGQLDFGHPIFTQSETPLTLTDQADGVKVRHGMIDHPLSTGTQEPSRASTSHSQRSDVNQSEPRFLATDNDRSQSPNGVLDATVASKLSDSTLLEKNANLATKEPSVAMSKERDLDRWKFDPSRTEIDLRQQRIASAVNRTSIDKPPKSPEGASNGFPTTTTQSDQVRPLLSLLEKEPPSRHFSGQLDYVRHVPGMERHESILPLLHASNDKKTNGELDFLMAEFAEVSGRGRENGNLDSTPKLSHKTATKKMGTLSSNEGAASMSGIVSQTASGVLSGSGVLNARPGSATSSGLLSHMVSTLNADVAREYLEKVADLLLEFAQADTTVKSYMCSQSLLSRLFQMFNRIEPPILLKILKCINHLSTDPNCLENLQRADAIKYLIPNLDLKDGHLVSLIHSEVLHALFNLCKINKRRQEQAAENGIIPHLMHFIMSDSPLKQYALPLLCDMAHASRNSREQLRAHGGLDVYLNLLENEVWSVTALDSIAVCLAHDNDNRKVEQALLKKDAVQKLVKFFQSCPEPHFVHILEPFLKIITKSSRINTTLAVNGLTPLLIARLDHQDAIARLNLLKLIKAVYEHHPRPKQLIVENNLPQKLQNLIEERRDGQRSGGQVLVKQMATSLLKALHINTVL
ncbi:MAP3K epsilon protein kinase 1 [Citrus sinensis]|uniref:MAP3K epsilon protein kinase 1-like n=1 Tax=Citrus sinensis TaxID=2711 RepID=UPI00219ED295|nr:MAP3K epsilon protein kinase 1-like [Citrus sinensis]KAH9706980.1 MAP3K epsilon protein kinase 1 [Citrus sinensis]